MLGAQGETAQRAEDTSAVEHIASQIYITDESKPIKLWPM
jgi:hypothetical protein